jgi:hypothetical protein
MIAAFLLAGAVLGALHLALLRRSIAETLAGRVSVSGLLRFASTALGLAAVARCGAAPLLAASAGFLAARTVALRRFG